MNLMIHFQLYFQIRENQRQKEKAIADFTEFVARTSNFNALKVRLIHSLPQCHKLGEFNKFISLKVMLF